MNRNVLKWILIGAVILGAAMYLILSEMPSGQRQGKQRKEKIVVGHSKAFEIEPIEGITISAAENALDKDRKFKLTAVDDKTYDRLTKLVAAEGVTPLFVFDFDAGLKSDEYFPGDFDVEWDLDRMGIPRSLQDGVCVYRIAGKGKNEEYIKYSSRVSNGKLRFRSNQNSYWELCLDSWKLRFYKPFVKFLWEYTGTPSQTLQRYFFNEPTRLGYPVQDESGDFVLYFRFRDTEVPNGFDAFVKNEKEAMARIDELEKYAKAAYNARLKQKYQEANVTLWDQIFSSAQVEAIKKSISVEQILQDTASKDPELKRLNEAPEANLPQSILTIKDQVIRANQYLNSVGLHHQDFEMPVYLVNSDVMGSEVSGACRRYNFCGNAFMLLKYEISDLNSRAEAWECMQATLVHELFHGRQQSYYAYTMMGSCPAESTAAVLERDAAKQWYNAGIIKLRDPNSLCFDNLEDLLADRTKTEIFGYPFDDINGIFSWTDEATGYSMASAIEGIREGTGKKSIGMLSFVDSYSFYGPHITTWSKWIKHSLNIDDAQFNQGWRYFGETNLPRIYFGEQKSGDKNTKTTKIQLKPSSPIYHLKKISSPKDYAVNTYVINLPDKTEAKKTNDEKYAGLSPNDATKQKLMDILFAQASPELANVFVYAKSGEYNPYVTFYWSDLNFEEYYKIQHNDKYALRASPSMYFAGNRNTDFQKNEDGSLKKSASGDNVPNKKQGYQLAVVTTQQSAGRKCDDYYVVALFAPEQLTLRKVKDDQITFVVPKPERKLTKEKLITGAVITYKDKNGNEVTRDVKAKDFGRKATWSITGCAKPGNSFSVSMHWYYQADSQTVYESPESEPVTWGAKDNKPQEEAKPTKEPKTNYWKQVNVRMNKSNTSFKESQDMDEEVSPDYRSIDFVVDKSEKSCDFSGMAATEETSPDGKTRYVSELYMTGTLTHTEPPVFWIPTQQYKARWDIADDPYFMKIKEPFVFEAKNTSSNQAACTQSKKDKIDTGHSTTGKVNWLRSASTTFEARFPEKDGPKFFTLTQTYSIKEREGSNLMATVTFEYDYEWIGEPEEEVKEEETAPEGGCWKLVKIETDDSHKHFKAEDIYGDKNRTTATISGGSGSYSMHVDWWGTLTNGKQFTGENGFIFKIDRQFHGGTPKQYYTPGKNFNLSWVSEELMVESLVKEMPFNAKSFDHYPNGSLSLLGYDSYLLCKTNNRIACDAKHTPDRMEMNLGVVPAKEAYPKGFVICEVVVLDYPSAAAPGCYIYNYYIYEWVDGEQKEQDLGNLGIGIEFPMNARDKAYFGEHGGSLLHRNDFGVKIPSGSYSVKKSGKGYILEGSGHSESSSPSPRASHNIEVRIVLDKNKIPVEASFSCQGFYEGTIRTMKTETTTFQATGTAKLTEKGPGPNARRGKCTSFNGIIHTESEGDFDYSNTEGGHLNIFWKRD